MCVLITRPTACMMSISDDLGLRNTTASSAGTSTPSDRHLAFATTLHSLESRTESRSHCMAPSRSVEFCVLSTCLESQANSASPIDTISSFLKLLANRLESDILLVYAMAVWSRSTPLSGSGRSSTRYSPAMRAVSVMLRSPSSVVAFTIFCDFLPPYFSDTPRTITS